MSGSRNNQPLQNASIWEKVLNFFKGDQKTPHSIYQVEGENYISEQQDDSLQIKLSNREVQILETDDAPGLDQALFMLDARASIRAACSRNELGRLQNQFSSGPPLDASSKNVLMEAIECKKEHLTLS